jgi:aminoglycoside phosphotransferase (APT) family kinase protein
MRGVQFDSLAWERCDAKYDEWCKKLLPDETLRTVGRFIVKESGGGLATELTIPQAGGFNACVKMDFENSASLLIRFPQPGAVKFPEEKIRREVAVMRYVADYTAIPVPFVLRIGMSDEGPAGLGPFILMEYIRHARNMSAVLNTPGTLSQAILKNDC